MAPNLYIVAGPNGAGKTTFAREFLPNYAKCLEFVNADLIAGGLAPFYPERAAIRAGRLMLEQIRLLAGQNRDFGFETTLAGKSYVRLLTNLKAQGYQIHLYFLWIKNVDIAIERIADRVRRGGHSVPEDVVRRRFIRGIPNFFNLYRPLMDFWVIFDNSTENPVMIAYEEDGDLKIIDPALLSKLSVNMVRP